VKPDKSDEQASELVEPKSGILSLRAQMRRIEEERDILKKAARYFERARVKYWFINDHRHEFNTLTMCRVLQMARSGFYK